MCFYLIGQKNLGHRFQLNHRIVHVYSLSEFGIGDRTRAKARDWSLDIFPNSWSIAKHRCVQAPVAGFSRVLSRNFPNQLILSRSNASQADMSERITRSPICRPSLISMVLTDARPSLT